MLERGSIRRGDRLVSPAGTKWQVIKVWTGPDGSVWYKIMSERGRIQNKLFYEFEDWSKK